ncbi:hypothetical protein CTI12_AA421650 [Artemisia annua]|uniref:Uncharacterized protein n=1 Tax=Artemisia annua TaxID=35608 RepID=A0A2U1M475_ARTAN|nr:hypothetical protein CTI12_AA421650 [Artemisia annua]
MCTHMIFVIFCLLVSQQAYMLNARDVDQKDTMISPNGCWKLDQGPCGPDCSESCCNDKCMKLGKTVSGKCEITGGRNVCYCDIPC